MLTRDGIAGLFCLALSLGMLTALQGLPRSPLVPVGPDFYPRIVLVLVAGLSALLVVFDIVKVRRRGGDPAGPSKNYRLVFLTFVVFLLYIFAIQLLGFRIATFAYVAVMQWTLDPPRRPRAWLRILLVSGLTAILGFVIFEQYLSVLMPRGTLTGL